MRAVRGFTLLEIMVALMIFATAAVALSKSLTESASSTGALEQRQFADLVAQNHLVGILREGYENRTSGQQTLAGFDYQWKREVSDTPHPAISRVDITVRMAGSGDILASRTAYLRK